MPSLLAVLVVSAKFMAMGLAKQGAKVALADIAIDKLDEQVAKKIQSETKKETAGIQGRPH